MHYNYSNNTSVYKVVSKIKNNLQINIVLSAHEYIIIKFHLNPPLRQ